MSTRIYLSNEIEAIPAYGVILKAARETQLKWVECCGVRFVPFGSEEWFIESSFIAPVLPADLVPHVMKVTRRSCVSHCPELTCGKYEQSNTAISVTRDLHGSGHFIYWFDGEAPTLETLAELESRIRGDATFMPTANYDKPTGPTYDEIVDQLDVNASALGNANTELTALRTLIKRVNDDVARANELLAKYRPWKPSVITDTRNILSEISGATALTE